MLLLLLLLAYDMHFAIHVLVVSTEYESMKTVPFELRVEDWIEERHSQLFT